MELLDECPYDGGRLLLEASRDEEGNELLMLLRCQECDAIVSGHGNLRAYEEFTGRRLDFSREFERKSRRPHPSADEVGGPQADLFPDSSS